MKHVRVGASILVGLLLLSAVAVGSARRSTVGRTDLEARSAGALQDNGDTIVYLTKTGAKYHRAGCSSLRRSAIPVKLRDAVNRGFGPCANCKPPVLTTTTQPPASTAPRSTGRGTTEASAADNGDTIVYVTKTGAKYHRAGCRSLSKSQIPMKLRDAVAKGYTACAICRPPLLTKR